MERSDTCAKNLLGTLEPCVCVTRMRSVQMCANILCNRKMCVQKVSVGRQSDFHVIERFLASDIVDLCDVLRASVSVEHVLRGLELMTAVQHCPNLVGFALLVSSTLQALRTFAVLGFRLHLHCLLNRGERDDISNLMPETFDSPSSGRFVDNPDNSLIENISLFEGLFQRYALDLGSHRFLYKL